MDEFAQSRDDNDLFGDEFEPVPVQVIVEELQRSSANNSIERKGSQRGFAHSNRGGRGVEVGVGRAQGQRRDTNGGNSERGRGRSRGDGGRSNKTNGLADSRYAFQPTTNGASEAQTPALNPTPRTDSAQIEPSNPESTLSTTPTTTVAMESFNASQSPQTLNETQPISRVAAVRGDRSATGGPAHKKLTESELSDKMAKMAILNAQKAEKFRLSEADSAAFAQKEKELKKKRVEEQKNSRAMDMERAKNRERKLKAQGVREWDSEKLESDIVDGRGRGRSSQYVRGGHGGVIKSDSSDVRIAADSEAQTVPFRGRGGFEVRGRGSRGRGGRGGKKQSFLSGPSMVDDFPSLPTLPKSAAIPEPAPQADPEVIANDTKEKLKDDNASLELGETGKGADWADEMATLGTEKVA